MQLDFEMENFTSQSVTRRIMWHIDYRGRNPPPDLEKVVTELTVIQRDIRAIVPLAMVRGFKLAPAFWFDSGDGLLSLEDFAGRDGCGCGLLCLTSPSAPYPLLQNPYIHASHCSCTGLKQEKQERNQAEFGPRAGAGEQAVLQ